ncbi:MAG: TolC family protein [Treponema sp.]|nr:TolC family protein [Candidatus Treponema equi]
MKRVVGTAIFLFIFAGLYAEKMVLTPQMAVGSALENNINAKQGKITLDAAARQKSVSWNSVSPTASVTGRYSTSVPSEENSKDSISIGASINASLTPSLYTQMEGAKIAYEQQKISYDSALRNIEFAVLKAYYGILYGKENLDLKIKNLETKKKQYEANLAKYNRGMLSRVDVLSAQINWQNSVLDVDTQRTTLENTIAQFKQTVGIDQSVEVEFIGSFDSALSFERLDVSELEKKSSAIEALQKQVLAANNNLLAARFSAYGPSLSAGYSYSYSSMDGGENWNDGGSLSFGVSIPLDGLLPWSTRAQAVENYRDTVEGLELKLADERTTFEINTDALVKKINQSVDNIKVRKSSIDLAQTNYEMTLEAYNHGTRDLLTLQSAQDSLLSARVNLVAEANTLMGSIYELENECGWEFGSLLGDKK